MIRVHYEGKVTEHNSVHSYSRRHAIRWIDLQDAAHGEALLVIRWRNGAMADVRIVTWTRGLAEARRLCKQYNAKFFVNSVLCVPHAEVQEHFAKGYYMLRGMTRVAEIVRKLYKVKREALRAAAAIRRGVCYGDL